MGIILSLTYWIPFLWMMALGHTLHGIGCGLACFAVAMIILARR